MPIEQVTIQDAASGAAARVLVGFGFNCFSFQTEHAGRRLEALWAADSFASGTHSPSGSGIPILFPFPGRIQGTQLNWEGRRYTLPEGDGRGNAIHGFVHRRPWRMIEQSASRVVGQFQASIDDPILLAQWPTDFCITADYQVTGNSLSTKYLVENPDRRPLPFGLGTHPYFRVPLGGNNADQCLVELPVTQSWELDGMIATGKQTPLPNSREFHVGLKFGDMTFDNVFGGLKFSGGTCTSRVRDPDSGRTLTLTFDDAFRECVVYNPGHREAVCIEPYTCVPDPFRLTDEGVNAGLRVLPSGESMSASVEITVA